MSHILQNLSKFSVIMLGGMLVTLSLFFTMQYMITSDFEQPAAGSQFRIADITEPELELEIMKKQPLPEKPIEPDEPPPIEFTNTANFETDQGFQIQPPEVPKGLVPSNDFGISNANAVPLVQVPAAYPTRALQNGIEGYIVVEFDVDEAGQVINPRVIYEEPEGYFKSAAFKALERYRYQPKIVNGKTVGMYGVQQKISFTLEE